MTDKQPATDENVSLTPESLAKQQADAAEQETTSQATPEANSAAETITMPRAEFEALKTALEAEKHRAEKQWDTAVRAKAEAENARRRAARDVESAHKFGVEKLLNELLPIIDSLEQALLNLDGQNEQHSAMLEGISLTLKMFEDTLAKFAIVKLNPEGEMFNPAQHEAMSMLDNQEVKPGTILHVVQKGYLLHDRLLRPARVIVARTPTTSDETA